MKFEKELREQLEAMAQRFAEQVAKLVFQAIRESMADAVKEYTKGSPHRQLSIFSKRCRESGCVKPSAGPMYGHLCREHGAAYREAHKNHKA